nr:50S ribosomal protein L16 [endosymbiont GvMRE of Glomus versiforme]
MLIPKKTKYRYNHSYSYEGYPKGNRVVSFGEFGLKTQEGAYITNRQIEAGRKFISPYVKKTGKMWIRVFPHLGKTKKSVGVRMGSGKGSIEEWVAVVKSGTIIYEIKGVSKSVAYKVLKKAGDKLPKNNGKAKIKYKVVERNE